MPRLGNGRCFVIGEVALSHDGSLGLAHKFIDAIATAGADAVKFQTHIAAAESTPAEPFRVKFTTQDATRYDYWKRMEFSEAQWHELFTHATDRGLVFMSSPFSIEAVELLDRLGMALWKIGSGEVSNDPMLDRIADTGRPVLLSSGMSSWAELDRVVARLQARAVPLTVMQCTTAYPCPPEKIGLNMLELFRQRYGTMTGLSDHSATIFPCLAAATLGADAVEVHVTMSREMFGPDVVASITTSELRQMVEGIRVIEQITANPIDKDAMAGEMTGLRAIFNKSVVARVTLEKGTVLREEHLAAKKPGTGLAAARLPELIGRRISRRVEQDALLSEDDLERAERL